MTLTRIRRLVSSNWHALLDAAEDPVKLTDELLREMAREVDRAWVAAVQAMAQERLLADQRTRRAAVAVAERERARRAAAEHDDDAARDALRRALLVESEVAELAASAARATVATSRARAHVRRLEDALAAARSRRAALVARERAAATVVRTTCESPAGSTSAFAAFERLEERIGAREAEAGAWEDVALERGPAETPEPELDAAVEADLAALKTGA